MFGAHISTTITAKDFPSERQWNRAKQDAHDAIGKKWHGDMLEQHFYKSAASKYNHEARSAGYLTRKKKMAARGIKIPGGGYVQRGGVVDNVYSGAMAKMLKGVGVIRSYPSRVTVTMQGPRYMTMRVMNNKAQAAAKGWKYGQGKSFSQTAGKQPDKIKEISTTTEAERKELATVADHILERHAAGW